MFLLHRRLHTLFIPAHWVCVLSHCCIKLGLILLLQCWRHFSVATWHMVQNERSVGRWTSNGKILGPLKTIVHKGSGTSVLTDNKLRTLLNMPDQNYCQDRLLFSFVCTNNSGNDDVANRKHQMNKCKCIYHIKYINIISYLSFLRI